MKKKLIVIEGIDCSGKTTLGRMLAKDLGWRYEHEPTFSSEEADRLNFSSMNAWQREYYFLKDRIRHQVTLHDSDCILDSYILRGMVYAKVFSAGTNDTVIEFINSIYMMPLEFKQPDLTIFIDQDPKYAHEINESRKETGDYNPKLTPEILLRLHWAYKQFIDKFKPSYTLTPVKNDLESTYKLLKIYVDSFLKGEKTNENKGSG